MQLLSMIAFGAALSLQAEAPGAGPTDEPDRVIVDLVFGRNKSPATQAVVYFVDEDAIDRAARTRELNAGVSPEWAAAHGIRLLVDARGRVAVPRLDRRLRLVAFHQRLSGYENTDRESDGHDVLQLWSDEPIWVEVVDTADQPMPQVPLSLVMDDENSMCGNTSQLWWWSGITGEDGRVRVDRGMHAIEWAHRPDGIARSSLLLIKLDLPGAQSVQALLDPRLDPSHPIRFVAPKLARLRLRARDPFGNDLGGASSFRITASQHASGRLGNPHSRVLRTDGDSIEVLVEANAEYVVEAAAGPAGAWSGSARIRVGSDDALLIVPCEQSRSVVFGRAVDELGRPIAGEVLNWFDWSVTAEEEPDTPSDDSTDTQSFLRAIVKGALFQDSPRSTKTDALGAFAIPWASGESKPKKPSSLTIELIVRPKGVPSRGTVIRQQLAPAAELQLGDVVLTPMDLVVSGQVVTATGAPASDVRVESDVEDRPPWNSPSFARTDESGRFEMCAIGEAPVFLLTVEGASAAKRLRVPRGTLDLVIVLDPAPPRQAEPMALGSILVEEWIDPRDIDIRARSATTKGPSDSRSFTIHGGELLDVEFFFSQRYPHERLLTLHDVDLRTKPDPRLEQVDLRGLIRSSRIEVTRPDGTPASYAPLGLFTSEGRLDESPFGGRGHCDRFGRQTVLTTRADARLWVGERGMMPVEVPIDGAEHRVTLSPGPAVELVLHGLAECVGEDFEVRAKALLISADSEVPCTYLKDLLPTVEPAEGDGERFLLTLPFAGDYRFELELGRWSREAWSQADLRVHIASSSAPTRLEVQVDAASLARRIERITR